MSTEDFYRQLYFSNENILMHGPGGTGKTYDIKQYIEYLKTSDDKPIFAYLAPTGTAANNIEGMTIHSFFKFGVYTETDSIEDDINMLVGRCKYQPCGLQILIIDEISMVGYRLFSAIDRVLRNKYDLTKPMGGVRCIFSGDFLQLQPVKDEYCFKTDVWNNLNLVTLKYDVQKRYTCDATFDLLMRLRINKLTPEDKQWLTTRVEAYKNGEHEKLEIKPVLIYTRNSDVDMINQREMKKINSQEYIHVAKNVLTSKSKRQPNIPEWEQNKILDQIVDRQCVLKVGANVMLYRNFSVSEGLTNGRLGIVVDINREFNLIKVRFSDNIVHTISPKEYAVEGVNWKLSRTQIPLRPAWAITSHKCQGMTLDSAVVKLHGCFAKGQMYTTAARVKSIDNLFIIDIDFKNIKTLDDERWH